MPDVEIEMFRRPILPESCRWDRDNFRVAIVPRRPARMPRLLVALAFMGCVQLWGVPTTNAAQPAVLLVADRDLGEAMTSVVQGAGADARQVQVRPFAIDAACGADAGPAPRLALMARTPTRAQIERCRQNADADANAVAVGRQAVALVVPMNSPVWSVNPAVLFRALGQNADDAPRPTKWSDIDPRYPNLPIGILLPPSGSRAQLLFDAMIMAPGCDSAAGARIPFDRKARGSFCSALRSDIPIARRDGGTDAVGSWATSAAPGQIAVVSVAELAQLERRAVPLLLDNVLPTGANIDNGLYPVSEQVELLIVVPHAADQVRRDEARDMAFKLLAEASIGPSGTLSPAGLIPLPPAQRVASRSQSIEFMEQR